MCCGSTERYVFLLADGEALGGKGKLERRKDVGGTVRRVSGPVGGSDLGRGEDGAEAAAKSYVPS